MARVFIGIPTFNRPQFVRETIASVLAQHFTDFRIIVSDDCSEPPIADALERYINGLADERIMFHRQAKNVGEYGLGRFFMEAAKDDVYFMILHDDDTLEPDYLERAVSLLDARPWLAYFVANARLMDVDGVVSPGDSVRYRKSHGREGVTEGEIDVLGTHLQSGFTPISGTLFRRELLNCSGFVDEDCFGNYPFEANVFLRLGEQRATAWFCSDELIRFRFHIRSLRNSLHLMENPDVVDTMKRLFEKRRFEGADERRRRVVLSRLYRASALIAARRGQSRECRRSILGALQMNPRSIRAWAWAPICLLGGGLLRRLRPVRPALATSGVQRGEGDAPMPPRQRRGTPDA